MSQADKLTMKASDIYALAQIDWVCKGYSSGVHWCFWREVFKSQPWIKEILVLGVYHGRDIAYMSAILKRLNYADFHIVGVDRFEDKYCEDWPEERRKLGWEAAGYGEPPSIDKARANLKLFGFDVELVKQDALDYLRTTKRKFDFIYIDITHDYETTREAIRLAVERSRPESLIGGDDYSDEGTWGVKKAVDKAFPEVFAIDDRIWLAQASDYRGER